LDPGDARSGELHADLASDLSAAAHLIHGSSEQRFTIRCARHISQEEIEGVGFGYGDLKSMLTRYDRGSSAMAAIGSTEKKYFSFQTRLGLWAYAVSCEVRQKVGNGGLTLGKYSVGIGTGLRSKAKRSCSLLAGFAKRVEVIPVWNKSNREHTIIGSEPSSVRQAADAPVKRCIGKSRILRCRHITLQTVERFLAPCDFYTIDVADSIGQSSSATSIESFVNDTRTAGCVQLEGVHEVFETTPERLKQTAQKFLAA